MEAKVWAHEIRAFTRYRSVDGSDGVTNLTAGVQFKDGLYVGGTFSAEELPITTDNVTIAGEAGDGYVAFAAQSTAPVLALAHVYADAAGKIVLGHSGSQLHGVAFDNQLLTAKRTYIVQNKSGTWAMTDDNVSQFNNDAGYLDATDLSDYVKGPASTVSGRLPSFNGTTGKLIQDSGINIAGTVGKTLTVTGSLTIGADTSLTGGGTFALGGFIFTVPATGTAALLNLSNVFTGTLNTFSDAVAVNSTTTFPSLSLNLSGIIKGRYIVANAGGVGSDIAVTGDTVLRADNPGNLILQARQSGKVVITTNNPDVARLTAFASGGVNVLGTADPGAGKFQVDGDLVTANTTFNLINAVPTTVNFAGAATVLNLGNSTFMKSSNHASQTTGWGINGTTGGADFRYVFADGLHAKSFITDLEQALAGLQIISKSVAVVGASFTVPAAGAAATLRVRDLPSAPNMAAFQSGDDVVLRSFSRAAGSLTIADAVGVVTAYADGTGANDGTQTWTWTRRTGGNAGTMTAGTVIAPDALALDFGTTGSGYYEVNAIDGANAINSPYAQIVTWATSPVVANRTVRARFGKLTGITGIADEHGILAGTYSATNGQFFRASNSNFELHGINLLMWDGTTNVVKLDRTAPSFAMGNPLPTAYGTGTGIWMGKDSSVYKFRVGIPGGAGMFWDGTNLTIDGSGTFTGSVTATSGFIGGFTIGADYVRDTANSFGLASTVTGGDDVRFWAGNTFANRATAPFRLTEAGVLTATSANITGAITASSGSITGPLTISGASGSIAIGTTPPTSATVGTGIWLDRTGLYSLSSNTQNVTLISAGLTAGGGNVLLDSSGLSLVTGITSVNKVKWVDSGTSVADIYTFYSGNTSMAMRSLTKADMTTSVAEVTVLASNNASTVGKLSLWSYSTAHATNPGLVMAAFTSNGTFGGLTIGDPALNPNAPTHMLDVYGTGWFQSAVTIDGSLTVVGNIAEIKLSNGALATPSLHFGTDTMGWYRNALNQWTLSTGGATAELSLIAGQGRAQSGWSWTWTPGASTVAADVGIGRNGIGVLEVNSSVAGTLRDLKLRAIEMVNGNLVLGTTTGTKIGTATSQKLSFWNATPVVQPTAVADATDAASAITQLNSVLAKLRTIGIIAT